jgi:hypothetical protein
MQCEIRKMRVGYRKLTRLIFVGVVMLLLVFDKNFAAEQAGWWQGHISAYWQSGRIIDISLVD